MLSQDRAAHDASDAELARRVARSGGAAAAEERELCRRFAPRIRLYGLRHLRDEDRARDLVQSVLLAVIEALRAGRVEDVDRVDRYVLATCRHLASRARRADTRAEPLDDASLDAAAVLPQTDAVDTGALLMCMGGLDVRSRTVLQLSFYGERSAIEIASALGTTAGNVRVVRHRAIALLRQCLEGAR
jgi:RNA polymerase sigma-70 factor (ECF subfamily)